MPAGKRISLESWGSMSNESELRRRMEALKKDEQRLAPPFPKLPRGEAARRPRVWPRLAGATAALLILIAIPIALRRWSSRNEKPQFVSISSWRAPTDFLL